MPKSRTNPRRPNNVTLVQVRYESKWTVASMSAYLHVAGDLGAELAIFPECFPFGDEENAPDIEKARDELARINCPPSLAFIAGGYVKDDEGTRNAVFLVYEGGVRGSYFKQFRWKKEGIKSGAGCARFVWGDGNDARACVPLICADVYSPLAAQRKKLFKSAREVGAQQGDLFVVSAYAGVPHGARWRSALFAWAEEFESPVAFCNFAGVDPNPGPTQNFGHGGSDVFWEERRLIQPEQPGVYVHDLADFDGPDSA